MRDQSDATIEILKQIRDEVRNTNSRLDETNSRLDGVTERLDGVTERLDGVTERLDSHEVVLEKLVRQSEITNEGLERHEKALGQLIDEVQGLNSRFDNFLTGSHQESHKELSAKVETLETRLGRLEERFDHAG